jgi:hypothetical protein
VRTVENTRTWADGFGRWHASVPLTDRPHADALRARKLIIDALTEREGPGFDPRRVHVTRERVTNHGTVVYQEK